MLIASKYEEIYFPQVQDFVYITDHSYSEDEVRGMERVMLKTIGYNLGIPASIHFLRRYSKLNQVSGKIHVVMWYYNNINYFCTLGELSNTHHGQVLPGAKSCELFHASFSTLPSRCICTLPG